MSHNKYLLEYDSIAVLNPFWGLVNRKMATNLTPIAQGVLLINNNVKTPEAKMNM